MQEIHGVKNDSLRAATIETLLTLRFEGISGPISFGPGRIADRRETIVTVKNSRLVPVAP